MTGRRHLERIGISSSTTGLIICDDRIYYYFFLCIWYFSIFYVVYIVKNVPRGWSIQQITIALVRTGVCARETQLQQCQVEEIR
jgi:hypothetical protein